MCTKNFPGLLLKVFFILMLALVVLPVQAKKWTVSVKSNSFTPYNLTHVRARDTIKWVWVSGSHSTTSVSVPDGADTWNEPINKDTTSFIYIPTVNGTYFYRSTPDSVPGMNGQFTVTGASGIGDNERPDFLIFPNPFHGQVNINFPGNHDAVTSIEIISQDGKMARSVTMNPEPGSKSLILDAKDLPCGTYLFRFIDGTRTISVQKAIRY